MPYLNSTAEPLLRPRTHGKTHGGKKAREVCATHLRNTERIRLPISVRSSGLLPVESMARDSHATHAQDHTHPTTNGGPTRIASCRERSPVMTECCALLRRAASKFVQIASGARTLHEYTVSNAVSTTALCSPQRPMSLARNPNYSHDGHVFLDTKNFIMSAQPWSAFFSALLAAVARSNFDDEADDDPNTISSDAVGANFATSRTDAETASSSSAPP